MFLLLKANLSFLIEREHEFLRLLDFDSERESAIPPSLAGTCEWIFTAPTWKRWYNSIVQPTKVLWIQGRAGSGKSVLARHILGSLRDQVSRSREPSPPGRVKHAIGYFLDARSPKQSDTVSVVKSFLFQLLSADPALFRHIHGNNISFKDKAAPEHLIDILRSILQDVSSHETIIVVDAFDEAIESSKLGLLKLLNNLSGIHGVKLLCTSRSDAVPLHADYLIELDHNGSDDIRCFVSHQINQLKVSTTFKTEIIDRICSSAQGSFLWTRLVLERIQASPTIHDLRQAIKVPSGLFHLFAAALDRVSKDYKTHVHQALYFVMLAKTPLTIQCLIDLLAAAAVSSKTPAPGLADIEEVALLDQDRFQLELRPFVRFTHDRVMLSHPTLQDRLCQEDMIEKFVTHSRNQGRDFLYTSQTTLEVVQSVMAEASLKYVLAVLQSARRDAAKIATQTAATGWSYTSIYWIEHVRDAGNWLTICTWESFQALLAQESLMQSWIEVFTQRASPYHLIPNPDTLLPSLLCAFDIYKALHESFGISLRSLQT